MASPEHGPAGGPDRRSLIDKLIAEIKKLFNHKKLEEEAEKALEAAEEMRRHETSANWETERDRRAEEERRKKYKEIKSAEAEEETLSSVRSQLRKKTEGYIEQITTNPDFGPQGSGEVMEEIRGDEELKNSLKRIAQQDAAGADAINNLLTNGEVYRSSVKLIEQAQKLAYAAKSTHEFQNLREFLNRLSDHAQRLIQDEYYEALEAARHGGKHYKTAYDFIKQNTNIIIPDSIKVDLHKIEPTPEGEMDRIATWRNWKPAVGRLITEEPYEVPGPDSANLREIKEKRLQPDERSVARFAGGIDAIWSDLVRKESAGQLSSKDLEEYRKKMVAEEAKAIPKDVIPGSDDYFTKSEAMRDYTEKKYDLMAEMIKSKLRAEGVEVPQGITNVNEFIKAIAKRPGALGQLLDLNPEMSKLLFGLGKDSRKFRDRIFLAIHSSVLQDQRNSSHDNFGLYERADFTSFISLIRLNLNEYKYEQTGRGLGDTLAEQYNNLSNTLRQCRDIDFFASQPTATAESVMKSLGFFQNEYVKEAFSLPAVNAAWRSYEMTLRSAMSANDGYLPPGLVEYNTVLKGSWWDNMSRAMLKKMIDMGAVTDVIRDKRYDMPVVDSNGYAYKLDDKSPLTLDPEDKGEDEINLYMTLAKGMGMVLYRFPEMIGNSRVPGSESLEKGMTQFHSIPYEGLARAMNFFDVFVHKWHAPTYKYFHFYNQVVPEGKTKIKVEQNNRSPAIQAFMAYQDGTFEEKYGEEAKRFMDLTNFSKMSSAVGLETLWRQYDSTIGWSDKQRQLLGVGNQIALTDKYISDDRTSSRIKEFWLEGPFKEEYRKQIIEINNNNPGKHLPTSGAGFDTLWKQWGRDKYKSRIDIRWDELNGRHPEKGKQHPHSKEVEEFHHIVEAYKKAYKARIWIQAAMRNPLVVSHNLKITVPGAGVAGKDKKISLHKMLVQEVLDITPEDAQFIEEYGRSADKRTASEQQLHYMAQILDLESDLAAVRERAINGNRDMTEEDFYQIIGRKKDARRKEDVDENVRPRVEAALNYWKKVRHVILGSEDIAEADRLAERIGMNINPRNGEYYEWDYKKIHDSEEHKTGISRTLENLSLQAPLVELHDRQGNVYKIKNMLEKAVNTKWDWILGTDDMAFNKMDLLNLGSRQLHRRGGDVAAHEAGGNELMEYFDLGVLPKPDKHEMAKLLLKVRKAYQGDMMEYGHNVVAKIAYLTDRFYSADLKKALRSTAQDVWGSRKTADAWTANGRREFWEALEHLDVLPPHANEYSYTPFETTDIHTLMKMCNAENIDVFKELLTYGLLIALVLTIYNAFKQSQEDEGSGGGGGGGGGGGHGH